MLIIGEYWVECSTNNVRRVVLALLLLPQVSWYQVYSETVTLASSALRLHNHDRKVAQGSCWIFLMSSTKSTLPASSAESSSTARAMSDLHEQVVTPWDVQGSVSTDGKQLGIDYDKLIDQFGTRRVDSALLERFERLTGQKPHIMLRRGMFFSHRYVLLQSWHNLGGKYDWMVGV